MATKTKTPTAPKTKIPNGLLPQGIKWAALRAQREGAEVWIITNPSVKVPASMSYGSGGQSQCQLWIMLRRNRPEHRKVYLLQWEQWTHTGGGKPKTSDLVRTTSLEWNLDYAHREWERLVRNGWRRVL